MIRPENIRSTKKLTDMPVVAEEKTNTEGVAGAEITDTSEGAVRRFLLAVRETVKKNLEGPHN